MVSGNFLDVQVGKPKLYLKFIKLCRWSAIAAHLPGRTDNEIKNYWNTHLKKRLQLQSMGTQNHPSSSNNMISQDSQYALPSDAPQNHNQKSRVNLSGCTADDAHDSTDAPTENLQEHQHQPGIISGGSAQEAFFRTWRAQMTESLWRKVNNSDRQMKSPAPRYSSDFQRFLHLRELQERAYMDAYVGTTATSVKHPTHMHLLFTVSIVTKSLDSLHILLLLDL